MTVTRSPKTQQTGSRPGGGRGGPRPPRPGPWPAGVRVRLTAGAYLLATLAVVACAFALPALAPGRPMPAYLAATAAVVAGLLASLAAHELGHAVVARRHGAGLDEVRIGFAGGTRHGKGEFASPRALGRVAAAGPAVSMALATAGAMGLLAAAHLGAGLLVVAVFAALSWINVLLTIVSVLPGAGTDGGQIVQALSWARSGDRARSAVTAARTGQLTGALLIAGGVALLLLGYLGGLWAGLIGLVMAGSSRAQAREELTITAVTGMRVRDALPRPTPPVVHGWQTVRAFLDGAARAPARAGPADTAAGQPQPDAGVSAFGVRDFEGRPAGVVTLTQLAAVPAGRRDSLRVLDVATPASDVVTTTPDESLSHLLSRLATARVTTPAALHTAGHALVLGPRGILLGVLTPADFARAGQAGVLRRAAARARP